MVSWLEMVHCIPAQYHVCCSSVKLKYALILPKPLQTKRMNPLSTEIVDNCVDKIPLKLCYYGNPE